jgi:hypothetical protein
MTKHVKISDENYKELIRLIGVLQMKQKRRITIDEAIDFLLEKVKVDEH